MKRIMLIIAFLAISVPVWTLKPMEDSALSSVSGPDSLNMNPKPSSRLFVRFPGKGVEYKGIGKMLMRETSEIYLSILYDKGDSSRIGYSGVHYERLAYSESLKGYKERFMNVDSITTDIAYGKDDPLADYDTSLDTRYYFSSPLTDKHSLYYISGSYRITDESQFWISKPYGGTEMRRHFMGNSSTFVHPGSWVDVKTR